MDEAIFALVSPFEALPASVNYGLISTVLVTSALMPSFGTLLLDSLLMVLMPQLTAAVLGVESDNIDKGCQRTRRERHCRLREVT